MFVDELDEGDSFTASLMDILVKELADRRTRSHEADRHLICDSTAKGLRSLASTSSVYRPRTIPRYASRRSINLAEYLAVPPDPMDLESGDHFNEEDFVAHPTGPPSRASREVRDFYDAYLGARLRSQTASSSREQSGEPPENNPADDAPTNLQRPLMGWLSPRAETRRSPSASSGPSLARQGPIRRATRSRTVDFNDFTSRRRLELRHNATDDSAPTLDEYPAEGLAREELLDFPSAEAALHARSLSAPTRRFEIHLPSWRHGAGSEDVSSTPWTEVPNTVSETSQLHTPRLTPLSQLIEASRVLEPPVNYTSEAQSRLDESIRRIESARLTAPRLRRGGLRAPESLLPSGSRSPLRSMHASPFPRSRSESP